MRVTLLSRGAREQGSAEARDDFSPLHPRALAPLLFKMNPELGLAWFRVAIFITLVSGVLLLFLTPGTAEFIISVASLAVGVAFIAFIAFFAKRG